MANIREWSTGEIGNTNPTRDNTQNPNTKGLTISNRPGVEAYIEDDAVDAYIDNRPLKNLVSNDVLLDNNTSDVASEVDYGIFKARYNEFDIEVLPTDSYNDPENTNFNISITPLRVKSGSSIINGSVTRIGDQKIIYFIKDNKQIIFPTYGTTYEMSMILDDPGYRGLYKPVYDSVVEGLPANFENYEIQIVNKYTAPEVERITYFKTFRDWEDIVPYKPQTEKTENEIVNFESDINYGQDSQGYWLRSGGPKSTLQNFSDLANIGSIKNGDVQYIKSENKYYKYDEKTHSWLITTNDRDINGVKGTATSTVTLKKDISVKDKILKPVDFTKNADNSYSHKIVTDGIFFEDITWTDTIKIDSSADILDLYIDTKDNIYFITKGTCIVKNAVTGVLESKKSLFRLTSGAIELEDKATGTEISDTIVYTRMRKIGNYLFLLGTNGFITTWDFNKNFNTDKVTNITYFTDNKTTEAFKDIYLWENTLFIASDKKIFYTDFNSFEPLSSNFTEIDLQTKLVSKANKCIGELATIADLPLVGNTNGDTYFVLADKKVRTWNTNSWLVIETTNIVQSINKIDSVKGNLIASSNLDKDVENLLKNPSYEDSSIGTMPIDWNLDSASGKSTCLVVANTVGDAISGNFKAFLTKDQLDLYASLYQDINVSATIGDYYTFSTNIKPTQGRAIVGNIEIEEFNSTTSVKTNVPFSLSGTEIDWTKIVATRKLTLDAVSRIRVRISVTTQAYALQIDCSQLENSQTASSYVENFNYLIIGFTKNPLELQNPPLALIDVKEKFVIQYTPNTYGNIEAINDTKFIKNNLVYAVSNAKIYAVNFLNNDREYDRISMKEINNSADDFNLLNKIKKLETINQFSDRIFVGGTVSNEIIKFSSVDNLSHKITFSHQGNTESLIQLLGKTSEILASTKNKYSIEFNRTENLYESVSGHTEEGKYIPGAQYGLTISIDDNFNRDMITIVVTAPNANSEPWTVPMIFNQISALYSAILTAKPPITIAIESSSIITEGFMSFGKLDLVKHIRGDIHKIFIKDDGSNYFYLARNRQIFKTKYDPNIAKKSDGTYPVIGDPNYFTNWDFVPSQYEVKQYKKIENRPLTISDNMYNTNYLNMGLDAGYKLVKGSVSVKTSVSTSTGFMEDVDYEIDYTNGRIIRKYSDNIIENGNYQLGSIGDLPNSWKKWGNINGKNSNAVIFDKINDSTGMDEYCTQLYISSTKPAGIATLDTVACAYQVFKPSNINIGDTYTFSIYLNSFHNIGNAFIYIVESESYKTPGHIDWMFSSPKLLADASGLRNDKTLYSARIEVNGNPTVISFYGNLAPTLQDVVNILNTQLHGIATVTWLGTGGFRITSKLTGNSSTVRILPSLDDIFLFSSLTSLNNINETPVDGSEPKVEEKFGLSSYNSLPEYNMTSVTFDDSNTRKWTRVEVTHTVVNPSSDCFRLEIKSDSVNPLVYPLFQAKAMFERNTRATSYVVRSSRSRIDPDSTVYVDLVELKSLASGATLEDGSVDYVFDTNSRDIILRNLDENSEYFFNYKYTRIFNPYTFGDRMPIYRILYDSRDDYFIYSYDGRIWAINQMLAMLAFDTVDPIYISYEYHFPRVDILKIRNTPDEYGNYCYLVKGTFEETNPYRPFDRGTYNQTYTLGVTGADVVDSINNEVLYEINITNYDYSKNELYDRRIFIDAKNHTLFNISLTPETMAYMPFMQDFNATNGMMPINTLVNSKIIPIIKNFKISQREEIGAWHSGYDVTLRKLFSFPGASFCIFVSTDYGDDNNNGFSEATAVQTVQRALQLTFYTNLNNRRNNIIITTAGGIVNEDILLNTSTPSNPGYDVYIIARTYAIWRGSLQNETKLYIQGIQFENSGIYPFAELNIDYCTLWDSTINYTEPGVLNVFNSEMIDCHNSIVRVTDVISPSPFIHPYKRNPRRDDGISGSGDNATSDNESIAPGDSWYNSNLATQPFGKYQFFRCLIHGSTDHIVQYDPNDNINNWISTFAFDQCTITRNQDLFVTNKYNISIEYSESILIDNGEERLDTKKIFDSNSNISIVNCFIDFDKDGESIYINYGEGVVSNRTTCKGGPGSDPLFLTITDNLLDFHLKSIARGSSTDSPCLDASSQSHDLGAYDELRERTEVNIPKKLRSKVAHIREGIKYPIVLNSEKVTITVEFKPVGTAFDDLILLDTRINANDTDYIVVCYNNNAIADTNYIIDKNPANTLDMAHHFRVVVANKEKIYSVLSPIDIISDEQYQQWHRLTFSINYELVYNTKTNFTDADRQQNIITLYHNDKLAIESFIKYDLQDSTSGELMAGYFEGNSNAWNYNNISSLITLGSDFKNEKILEGYYTEIRVDNRFIDRKELQEWLVKEFPFNDPYTKVNEATLAKTLDPSTLNEYWSLKTNFNRGAKWNKFMDETFARFAYLEKQFSWVLTRPTNNIFIQSDFVGMTNASITAASKIDWKNLTAPITIGFDWIISSINTRTAIDSEILLNLHGIILYNQANLISALDAAFLPHADSNVRYLILPDGRIKFYTEDYGVTQLELNMGNDYTTFGFDTPTTSPVVTNASYTIIAGDWTYGSLFILPGQNTDNSKQTIVSVRGTVDGLITDYVQQKTDGNIWGVVINNTLSVTTDYQDFTIMYNYTPSVLNGNPTHGGNEFNLSEGIEVIIEPADVCDAIAAKTVLALNAKFSSKFTFSIVKDPVTHVNTSEISIHSVAHGVTKEVRRGTISKIQVTTTTPGDKYTKEESRVLFLQDETNNNKDYYGFEFEFFDETGQKYYVWYNDKWNSKTDPKPDASGWFVTGITPGSIGLNGNNVWFEERPEFVNLSSVSMAVQRKSTAEVDLNVYQKLELVMDINSDGVIISPTVYYMSLIIYYDGYLKDSNINFLFSDDNGLTLEASNFDKIERNIGNWWLLKKKISITTPQKYYIGFKVLSSDPMYINGAQLEKNAFVTPFVQNATTGNGQIVISKSLLGENLGSVFFRWKPLFDYKSTEERIIFQVLGEKTLGLDKTPQGIGDIDKGFTIRYKYDLNKEYGTLIYSLNDFHGNNNSSWEVRVPDITWESWHSSAIIYDYNTDKYILAFDFYRQILDLTLVKYPMWSNVHIGRDAKSGIDPNISQEIDVIFQGDVNGSLSGKYWKLYGITGSPSYMIWYNVDGSSVIPDSGNLNLIQVAIATGADSTTVAQNTLMAIGAHKEFLVTRRNNILRILNKEAGKVTESEVGNAGIIISIVVNGRNSLNQPDYAYKSSEIAVKDIILTSATISDTEELKWHNSYEFFNEYLMINTLNQYKDDLQNMIFTITGVESSPLVVAKRLDDIESEMNGLQVSQGNLEGDVNILTNMVQSSQAVALEEIKTQLVTFSSSLKGISDTVEYMQDGGTSQWTDTRSLPTSDPNAVDGGKYNIFESRRDINTFRTNLDAEIATRITNDSLIRDDFGSTSAGYGASLIGINDKKSLFPSLIGSAKNIENALQDLAGYDLNNANAHRTNETIYSNSLSIATIDETLNSTITDQHYMMDGTTTGSNWSRGNATINGWNLQSIRSDLNVDTDFIAYIKDGKKTSSQGMQLLRFNTVITTSLPTGLAASDYTLSISVDGVISNLTISGSQCTTWNDLLTTLNATVSTAKFSIAVNDSYCKIQSNTYGSGSSAQILGGTLFTVSSLKAPGPAFVALETKIDGNNDLWDFNTMNLYTLRKDLNTEIATDLAYQQKLSATTGASNIGIADVANLFTATTVEDALSELAGVGRSTQTIKSNYDLIVIANTNIGLGVVETNKTKDGTTGALWTSSMNLKSHEDKITTINTNIGTINTTLGQIKDGLIGSNWDKTMNLKIHNDRLDNLDGSIFSIEGSITSMTTAISTESSARVVGDNSIRSDLASGAAGNGASMIGVRDQYDYFTKTTVEDVLAELHLQVKALEGAISWQTPVATTADLPTTGNRIGDARTVNNDGDGKPAQYICVATTGASQWRKIADIDWSNANSIAFDKTISNASSTNVQDAIDEVWKRTNDNYTVQSTVASAGWSNTIDSNGNYTYRLNHNLGTQDVVINVIDKNTNMVIGLDEIVRFDINNIDLYSATKMDLIVYCFASLNNYSIIINQYDSNSDRYSATIRHNLGSSNVMISAFNVANGTRMQPGDIQTIDDNSIRIFVEDNTIVLNVYIMKKIEASTLKDIYSWTLIGDVYQTQLSVGSAGYDSIYQFFDPATAKTVEVENVQIVNGTLIVSKADSSLVRMIVLK